MSLPKYCLDTHPLIWYFTGQKTLSVKSKKIIDDIFSKKAICFLSSIVLLETFHVYLKNKNFVFPKFIQQLRQPNIIIVPLDKIVLKTCYRLPKQLDIHDRIIVATALVNKTTLITKDKEIRKISPVKIIW